MNADNPEICITCHLKGNGCCLSNPELSDQMFGLTTGEIDAICKFMNLKPEDFTIRDIAPRAFMDHIIKINSIFAKIMPDGKRIRLQIKNGKCIFLENTGCALPTLLRPLFCRIYPFWFDNTQHLTIFASDQCLAQVNTNSTTQVINHLETDRSSIKKLYKKLENLADKHYEHLNKQ